MFVLRANSIHDNALHLHGNDGRSLPTLHVLDASLHLGYLLFLPMHFHRVLLCNERFHNCIVWIVRKHYSVGDERIQSSRNLLELSRLQNFQKSHGTRKRRIRTSTRRCATISSTSTRRRRHVWRHVRWRRRSASHTGIAIRRWCITSFIIFE